MNKRQIGSEYEKIACEYLNDKGYTIVATNYRCKLGEIDLIAQKQEVLVFCEVKFRANLDKGDPLEAIHAKKQRIISRCASWYMQENYLSDIECRFDVIGILDTEITHIEDAFPYAY